MQKREAIAEKIKLLTTGLDNIINDDKMSKGMKLVSIKEIKEKLFDLSTSIEEQVRNDRMADSIDGALNIRMVTSKGRTWAMIDELQNVFFIDIVSRPVDDDTDLTKVVYDIHIPSDSIHQNFETLPSALEEALFLTAQKNHAVKSYISNDNSSNIVYKVKVRLSNLK